MAWELNNGAGDLQRTAWGLDRDRVGDLRRTAWGQGKGGAGSLGQTAWRQGKDGAGDLRQMASGRTSWASNWMAGQEC